MKSNESTLSNPLPEISPSLVHLIVGFGVLAEEEEDGLEEDDADLDEEDEGLEVEDEEGFDGAEELEVLAIHFLLTHEPETQPTS